MRQIAGFVFTHRWRARGFCEFSDATGCQRVRCCGANLW